MNQFRALPQKNRLFGSFGQVQTLPNRYFSGGDVFVGSRGVGGELFSEGESSFRFYELVLGSGPGERNRCSWSSAGVFPFLKIIVPKRLKKFPITLPLSSPLSAL